MPTWAPTVIVLLVDDDLTVLRAVARVLEAPDYIILTAEDARYALEIIQEYGERVRVLVTDFYLSGGLNGIELEREAKKYNPKLRTVFVSGADLPEAYSSRYIAKPFQVEELQNRIYQELAAAEADRA